MQDFTISRRPGFEYLGEIKVQISAPVGTAHSIMLGLAVVAALQGGANLRYADLRYADLQSADLQSADLRSADLRSADLRSANLQSANLQSADLRYADLRYANLRYADLRSADLRSADLRSANLRSANLQSANLQSANLRYADLRYADLQSANLQSANLRYADLRYADLRSADLRSAKNPEEAQFGGFQIPQEGQLIVWKKLAGGYLAKLQIPAKAARTATPIGRKCRAESAKVVAIYRHDGKTRLDKGLKIASQHDGAFMYAEGAVVKPRQAYDASPWVECTSGIHFFLTREEAAAY